MRIKIIIFFLLFTINNFPAYSADIHDEFIDANNFIIAGEFQKAKNILYRILENNPGNMQIINNIAYIEAKTGNLEKAIEILRAYIRNDDDVDIIYKNLTNLYAYQANMIYEEALSIDESESKDINLLLIKNLKLENKIEEPEGLLSKEENII
jgi:tetratricopeptide (TPR) repeat protein